MNQNHTCFSPGHITGLFCIPQKNILPEKTGSIGAGISLEKGVTTTVSPLLDGKNDIIKINGIDRSDAEVSKQVFKLFRTKTNLNYSVLVDHKIDLPLASGFGTSGAGALSLAFALNDMLKNPLSKIDVAKVAHNAEIICKTGLGTITGEFYGGAEIRITPGAPSIGAVRFFKIPKDTEMLFLVLGPYLTKDILQKKETRLQINNAGKYPLKTLRLSPNLKTFLQQSRKFAEKTGLISKQLKEILKTTDKASINCSMLMFGEVLFTAGSPAEIDKSFKILKSFNIGSVLRCGIDTKGARII